LFARRNLTIPQQFSGKGGEIRHQRIALAVLLGIAEVGQSDCDSPDRVRLSLAIFLQAAWMSTPVSREKQFFLFLGKVADLEDPLDMLNRDGSEINGIGNLRDEAAVLAERFCQALAHAGGPPVQHLLENPLVSRDRQQGARFDAAVGTHCGRPYSAMAAFTEASAAAATDNFRSPQ